MLFKENIIYEDLAFVPSLINYTKNGTKTWQDLYEMYDIYGDDEDAWNKYLNEAIITIFIFLY